MLPSLAFSAVLLGPSAPMPKDTTAHPVGPAPQVIYLKAFEAPRRRLPAVAAPANVPPAGADEADRAAGKLTINIVTYKLEKREVEVARVERVNGKNVIKKAKQTIEQQMPTVKPLGERGEVFTSADGSQLNKEDAIKRLMAGAVALISMDGKPIDPAWLRVVDKNVIAIHSPEITGPVASYSGELTTPAPRLALLIPDADGTIRVPVADNLVGIGDDAGVVGGGIIAGNGRVIIQNINQPLPGAPRRSDIAKAPQPGQPGDKVPLDQVQFEAFTASGESVSKEEALKRLKAGGIVAIAGSNQKPDEAYLKAFSPDLLVLVAAELAIGPMPPLVGGGFPGHLVRPLPAQIQPLPAPIQPLPAPAPNVKPLPAQPQQDNGGGQQVEVLPVILPAVPEARPLPEREVKPLPPGQRVEPGTIRTRPIQRN